MQYNGCYYLTDIFTHQYNQEWMANKKSAVQCMRAAGFGTKRAEEKMAKNISVLLEYVEKQNGN